jgi:hypothetical protein
MLLDITLLDLLFLTNLGCFNDKCLFDISKT